jgi:hypothetical protein
VLNIAQQANILDDEMFAMLVLMAVITTAAAGPLLRLLFSPAQLVKEHAADLAADTEAAPGGKPPPADEASVAPGTARLVVLPHDVASASKLLAAAVATLAPGMRAHVAVVRFCTPADLHARTELGTGLLRSPEEVLSKAQLEEAVRAIARPNLTTAVTVATTEDPLGDALVHIRAAAPQLVVTDWPAAPEARARLRALVVHSPCTVVLWGGGGTPADSSPRGGAKLPSAAEDGDGATAAAAAADVPTPALPPTASHPSAPHRRRGAALLAVLRDEKAQDALVDAAAARLKRMSDALIARLPERLRRSDDSDDDELPSDEESAPPPPSPPAHGGSIELQPHALGAAPPSPTTDAASQLRVTANDAAGVVTPHTMAVAAASSLSPKFSKLMVTGWPRDAAERSELVAFVHFVEQDVALAVARRASRMPSLHAALMRRSTSSGEVRGGVSPPVSPPPVAPRGAVSAPELLPPPQEPQEPNAADA